MLALLHLVLVALLAGRLRARVALLRDFADGPGFLLALGVALFLVTWVDFTLFALFGWGALTSALAWLLLGGGVLLLFRGPAAPGRWRDWPAGFLLLLALVLARFWFGVTVDRDGTVWSNFNFVDTAFHLSIAQAFVTAARFPVVDLDMAPFPLKYHFLADFAVADLVRLGLPPLAALRVLNLLSAAALTGAVWATFARWLRLPARWVLLAALLFLCLNPSLLNLLHWLALHPPFFNPAEPFEGLLHYPYFNFEFTLNNLLEPQRGLVFALPVILLVLHAAFGADEPAPHRTGALVLAFALICLLPFAHIVGFAVLALSLAPVLWAHRAGFLAAWPRWLPFFAVGLLQLYYLLGYGPPTYAGFSGWDVAQHLPLGEFAAFPAFTRRAVFWFFADGDFLLWGAVFAALAFAVRRRAPAPWDFLRAWRWYFAATLACFVLINFYRYAFAWGDSNKFVLFLNLGLALLIALAAARGFPGRLAGLARGAWWFFFLLCAAPPVYELCHWVVVSPHAKIILFHRNTRLAADWLRTHTPPGAVVLTAAFNDAHFITPLAGRPTLAGIYSDWNPYLQPDRGEQIRRVYEDADFAALRALGPAYVCLSGGERLRYRLSPRWTELMQESPALVFHVGDGPADHYSVYLFDVARLPR